MSLFDNPNDRYPTDSTTTTGSSGGGFESSSSSQQQRLWYHQNDRNHYYDPSSYQSYCGQRRARYDHDDRAYHSYNNDKYQLLYEVSVQINDIMNHVSFYDVIYVGIIKPILFGAIILTMIGIILRCIIQPIFFPSSIVDIHTYAIQLLLSSTTDDDVISNNNDNNGDGVMIPSPHSKAMKKKKKTKKKLPSFRLDHLLVNDHHFEQQSKEKGIELLQQLSYEHGYIPAIITLAAYYTYIGHQPNDTIQLLSYFFHDIVKAFHNSNQSRNNNHNHHHDDVIADSMSFLPNDPNGNSEEFYGYYKNIFEQSIRNILCDAKAMMIVSRSSNNNQQQQRDNDHSIMQNDNIVMMQTLLRFDEYISIQYSEEFRQLLKSMKIQEDKMINEKNEKVMTIRQVLFIPLDHLNNNNDNNDNDNTSDQSKITTKLSSSRTSSSSTSTIIARRKSNITTTTTTSTTTINEKTIIGNTTTKNISKKVKFQ